MQKELEQILHIAEAITEPLGLCVVDVKSGQQGRKRTLEITIYRKGGQISLSDCEGVSRAIEERLEQLNEPSLSANYLLEVQSPGLARQLKNAREMQIFTGEDVVVRSKDNIPELGYFFRAKLVSSNENELRLANPTPLVEKNHKTARSGKKSGKDSDTAIKAVLPTELVLELKRISDLRLFSPDLF